MPGKSISVTGDEWTLTMDWLDGNQFRPCRVRRSAIYDVQEGLIVRLGADDGPAETADQDFNDMIVALQSEDQALNPLRPSGNPFDFTIPEKILIPGETPSHPA